MCARVQRALSYPNITLSVVWLLGADLGRETEWRADLSHRLRHRAAEIASDTEVTELNMHRHRRTEEELV